jgi:hypothetical protein
MLELPAMAQANQTWLIAGCVTGYAWIILLIIRLFSYSFRALSLITVIFLLGILTTGINYLSYAGWVLLVAVPLLTIILIGDRAGLIVLLFVWIVAGGTSYLAGQNMLQLLADTPGQSPINWLISLVFFLFVSSVLYSSIRFLLKGLFVSLDSEREIRLDLEAERSQMERRVQLRVQNVDEKLVQTLSILDIADNLYSIFDADKIVDQVVELVKARFDLYFVGIFEINDANNRIFLKAGTGEEGRQMIASSYSFPLGKDTLIGWSIINHQPRFASDAGQDAVWFDNPYLPQTHSELAIPLLTNSPVNFDQPVSTEANHITGDCLGILSLQSERIMRFDQDDVAIFQKLAQSLANAMENARRFSELQLKGVDSEERALASSELSEGKVMLAASDHGANGHIKQLAETLDVDMILKNTVQELADRFSVPKTYIQLGIYSKHQEGNTSGNEGSET